MNEPGRNDGPPRENKDPQEAEREKALKAFRAEMDRRIAEADDGKVIEVEEAFAQIREHARKRRSEMA